MFGGHLRQWEKTACDATECATAILRGDGAVPVLRKQFDNVADIPLVMIGPCSWPLGDVHCCPPVMHNLGYILTDVYNRAWENVSWPPGQSRTLTKARGVLLQRQHAIAQISGESASWNITTRRRLFAHWSDIFDGLMEDHLLVVPFLASVLSSALYGSATIQSLWTTRLQD